MQGIVLVMMMVMSAVDIDVTALQFGAIGDDKTDCTAAIQAAADAAIIRQQSQRANGYITAQTVPTIRFPSGIYRISAPIKFAGMAKIVGSTATIKQMSKCRSFTFSDSGTHLHIEGMKFEGGTNAIYISNPNINTCLFNITECYFDDTVEHAILTESTGKGESKGVLSATLNIEKCRFRDCAQLLDECCDFCNFVECQVQVSTAFAAPIPNDSGYVAFFVIRRGCFSLVRNVLTPADFIYGPNTGPIKYYWIWSTGSVFATNTRFGGENGGIPILLFGPAGVDPNNNNGRVVVFSGCQMSAGPGKAPDGMKTPNPTTAMVTLNGMPSLIAFNDNYLMFVAPHIVDISDNGANAAAIMKIPPKIHFGSNVNFPDTIRVPSKLSKYVKSY